MEDIWKASIAAQFGAALDMLENAVRACPEALWEDRGHEPEVWYLVYHTLFWLELYFYGQEEGFAPPAPFTLDELDPAGILPERVYSKDELLGYLDHGRERLDATLTGLTEARARQRCRFGWGEASYGELLLYNLRHVQHHAGQLNLILKRHMGRSPAWVVRARR